MERRAFLVMPADEVSASVQSLPSHQLFLVREDGGRPHQSPAGDSFPAGEAKDSAGG